MSLVKVGVKLGKFHIIKLDILWKYNWVHTSKLTSLTSTSSSDGCSSRRDLVQKKLITEQGLTPFVTIYIVRKFHIWRWTWSNNHSWFPARVHDDGGLFAYCILSHCDELRREWVRWRHNLTCEGSRGTSQGTSDPQIVHKL